MKIAKHEESDSITTACLSESTFNTKNVKITITKKCYDFVVMKPKLVTTQSCCSNIKVAKPKKLTLV